MRRDTGRLGPIMTVLVVLMMVGSSTTMAMGTMEFGSDRDDGMTLDEKLQVRAGIRGAETADRDSVEPQPHPTYRPKGRQAFEDEVEVLGPYPTSKTIMGMDHDPVSDDALLVGEQGLLLLYDGVYFSSVDTDMNIWLDDVSWHPTDGTALIVGDDSVFEYRDGQITEVRTGLEGGLTSVDFSPDGEMAIITDGEGRIYVYDHSSAEIETVWRDPDLEWTDAAWHPTSGKALISGYEIVENDNGIVFQGRVFEYDPTGDTMTNLDPELPENSDTDLYSVDWSDDGEVALLVGWSGLILSYDGTLFGIESYREFPPFLNVDISSRGEGLVVGFFGTVVRYEAGNLEEIDTNSDEYLYTTDFSNDGGEGLVGGSSGVVLLYDSDERTVEMLSFGISRTIHDVAWKPDWSYALLVGVDGMIYKFDGEDLNPIDTPTTETLLGVEWSPTGNRALIVGTGGMFLEYIDGGFGDPSVVRRLSGTVQTLWDVSIGPNGQTLLVGNSGEIRLWNNNFATKVPSRTNVNLLNVDWKDGSTAYIVGASGEVLRYRTNPVQRIDLASPANIQVDDDLYSVVWEEDKEKGIMVGTSGTVLKHNENRQETTLDDSYSLVDVDTESHLYDLDWRYHKDWALVVGDFGTIITLHPEEGNHRSIENPSNERLFAVDWKGEEYALAVGAGGAILRYWPNLEPEAVTLSSPTDITDNSMKVSWTSSAEGDFHHYELHMSETEGFVPSQYTRVMTSEDIGKTGYTVTDLRRDTTYYFRLRVVDEGGMHADSNEVYGHTLEGMVEPMAVTLDPPTDITSSAMILQWSRNLDTDFDHYEVHMSTSEGFNTTGNTIEASIDEQTETEYSVLGLMPNTTYFFKIKVVDEDGLFNVSNEVNGTTEDVNRPPDAVTLYEPFNITDDSLMINWSRNGNADFDRYEVHISNISGFNLTADTRDGMYEIRNETEHGVEGLTPNTTYFLRIRVYDTGGLYADSNQENATTLEYDPPPQAVVLYEPINVTETTVTLNWSMNNDTDFDAYEVHCSEEAGFEPNASTLAGTVSGQNTTTFVVDELMPGEDYVFKVRTLDLIGQFNDSNEIVATTLPNDPPEAVHLTVIDVEATEVTLKWTRNNDTDFARYEVHYSTLEDFTIDPSTLDEDITSKSSRIHKVGQLKPRTEYFFRIRVVDEFNLYNDSNTQNATTLGPNLPPDPVVLGEPQNITRYSMELYWSQATESDFSFYELHMSERGNFTPDEDTRVLKFTNRDQTMYNITGLDMEEEYYFVVRVYDTIGQFNDSNEVYGKTLPPNVPPTAHAGEDVEAYTTDRVDFEGTGTDPDGHIVKYEWDFESDGVWDTESRSDGEADHTYGTAGIYIATLRVTDNDGATDTDIVNVTIDTPPLPNQRPTADAGEDQTVTEGETVLFEGTGTDPDGIISLYEWDYDGDGEYDDYSYDDGFGEYTYAIEGVYKARLRVEDNENATDTDVVLITVVAKNTPPEADIDSPDDRRTYAPDDYIKFDGSTSKDDDGDSLTFEWTDSRSGVLSTKEKFTKQLRGEGSHVITLKVSDGEDEATDEVTIEIEEPENEVPEIKITSPSKNARVKGYIIVTGTATDMDGWVEDVCVQVDTGPCQKAMGDRNWMFELDTSRLSKGQHTIKVVATDNDDGEGEETVLISVAKEEDDGGESFLGLPGFELPLLVAAVTVVVLVARRRGRHR